MKLSRRSVLVASVVVSVLVGTGQRGDDGKVVVTVAVANHQSAPLQILGFILPDKVGDPPKLVLQNLSSNEVTAFWLDALVGKADGTGSFRELKADSPTFAHSNSPNEGWPQTLTIAPHARIELPQSSLRFPSLAFDAGRLRAACLHATAFLVRVEFADGSVWQIDNSPPLKQIWKDSLSPESVRACGQGREPDMNVLRRLEGWGYEKAVGTPTYAKSDQLTSYSFSCPVRQIRNKLVAVCPF